MNKIWLYRVIQLLLIIYVFIPEFSDAIPIIGWLDEATALGFVIYLQKRIKALKMEKKQDHLKVNE